jgi:membrane-associated phospholipid phosphatase
MGGQTSGQALKGPGGSAARPLLPGTGPVVAVAIVVVCVLVLAVQAVWLRHGMETGWLDTAIDARVQASLAGHPRLLAVLVWPGEPVPAAAMAAALALACIWRRHYRGAALVAISVPLAAALTELVLKPLIGWTPWGNPFPSGHVTTVAALATALTVLLASTPPLLRLAVAFTAFLMAAAVAVGVIGANMHHFTDTAGGAAVGTGTVLVTALILDRLSRAHSQRRGEGQQARPRPDPAASSDGPDLPGQIAGSRRLDGS